MTFFPETKKVPCQDFFCIFFQNRLEIKKYSAILWKRQGKVLNQSVFSGIGGLIAQSVEHRPFKAVVPGSSPGQLTTFRFLCHPLPDGFFFLVFSEKACILPNLYFIINRER